MKKPLVLTVAGAALFAGGYWAGTARTASQDSPDKQGSLVAAIAGGGNGTERAPGGAKNGVAEKEVRNFAPGKPFPKGGAKAWLLALATSLGGDSPHGNEMAFVEAAQILLTMDEASAVEVADALKELMMLYAAGDANLRSIDDADERAEGAMLLTMIRLSQLNPSAALTMLQGMPDGVPDEALRLVFSRLASQDPVRAEQMAQSLPEKQRGDALEGIMYSMARKDPAGALAFAERNDEAISDRERNRVLEQWARSDPRAAIAGAGKIVEKSGDPGAMREVFNEYMNKDGKAAAQWAASYDGPGATTVRAMMLEDRARSDPGAVLAEFSALQTSAANQKEILPLTTTLADSLAKKDPASARDWAAGLPAGEAQDAATQQLAQRWVHEDAPAASEWIRAMPPGKVKDGAVWQLTEAITQRDPSAAFVWAQTIQNESRREEAMGNVVRQWRQQDPEAAKTAMEALPERMRREFERSGR